MGRESTLALILASTIFFLGAMIIWHIIANRKQRNNYKTKLDSCLGLTWCNKGVECGPGKVCYNNACIPRQLCTDDSDCVSTNNKCYNAGVLSYCVPVSDQTPL